MRKTARHLSPSRVRYEQAHPTVSSRVSMEIFQQLQAAKKADGKSFGDILKIGLGILEVRTEGKASIQKQAHAKGYQKGYEEAEQLYKVTYACNVCRKTMAVTSDNAKQAVKKYLEDNGWGHQACHEKRP